MPEKYDPQIVAQEALQTPVNTVEIWRQALINWLLQDMMPKPDDPDDDSDRQPGNPIACLTAIQAIEQADESVLCTDQWLHCIRRHHPDLIPEDGSLPAELLMLFNTLAPLPLIDARELQPDDAGIKEITRLTRGLSNMTLVQLKMDGEITEEEFNERVNGPEIERLCRYTIQSLLHAAAIAALRNGGHEPPSLTSAMSNFVRTGKPAPLRTLTARRMEILTLLNNA